ncbi:hypothetical protein [Actinomyces trachealis]|uniref:hypothetical protein n=1 Tax=Actinomyces trachealis TaxID=2763540 RepID=UPI001892CF36|nr:hypothetical protein [Actinomyces trachealis]
MGGHAHAGTLSHQFLEVGDELAGGGLIQGGTRLVQQPQGPPGGPLHPQHGAQLGPGLGGRTVPSHQVLAPERHVHLHGGGVGEHGDLQVDLRDLGGDPFQLSVRRRLPGWEGNQALTASLAGLAQVGRTVAGATTSTPGTACT